LRNFGGTTDVARAHLLSAGEIYYFAAWVRAIDTVVYFDVFFTGGDGEAMFDLGRRFRVAPEDGWVQIGVDPDYGNFLPFRTNGVGLLHDSTTASRNIPGTVANEDTGNARMFGNNTFIANAGNWRNLVVAAFDNATGATRSPATGGYLITDMQLWRQREERTSYLGEAIRDFNYLVTRDGGNEAVTRFTPTTWNAHRDAVNAGRSLLRNPNSTQTQINDAVLAINATGGVLVQDDLFVGALQGAIDSANALNRSHFTLTSGGALNMALEAAEAFINSLNLPSPYVAAEQVSIDAQTTALRESIGNLVNSQAWTAVYNEARGRTQANYHPGSWEALETSITDFAFVPITGTQEQVRVAALTVRAAIDNLFSDSALVAVLTQIAGFDESNYTADSWAALMTARDQANEWRNSTTAVESGVQTQIERLEAAIEGLEERGGNCGCGGGNIVAGMLAMLMAAVVSLLFIKRKK